MRRKIDAQLDAWKEQQEKKPLVITGARQTGKTTSVLEFGRRAYREVVHIDFYRQPHLKAAFAGSLEPTVVVANLEALLMRDIPAEGTLLFFDEIQDCDQAVTALKFFCQDAPERDVVAAGSLLGVHIARTSSFPVGYVDLLRMHPLDFEEFCWAVGEERALALAQSSFEDWRPCPVHESLMARYREYLLVGGMPEAVALHAQGASLARVRKAQEDVCTMYVADMAKYTTATVAAKVVACWESLPAQLAKESGSTKFTWKEVTARGKAERLGSAVDWLGYAGIASKCTQVSAGVAPLKSFENPSSFKLYVADTGLLASKYDAGPRDLDATDARSARFRGGLAENYVMQQLVAADVTPYYWGMQSTYEVEFVVRAPEGVVPIEVKSGANVSSPSARRFADKYGSPFIYRVSARNFGEAGGVRSVPSYAAHLIAASLTLR